MQHVIANRPHKFILVKSALTKRDQGFIDLANLGFITGENAVAVVSHASVKAPKTIDRYTDYQVSKPIPAVPLLAPYFHSETFEVVAHDYQAWSRRFAQKLEGLSSFEGDIDIPHTGEMFRYINLWKSRLVKDIQLTIDKILEERLPELIIEPHNIGFLLSIWDEKVSLSKCLENLEFGRIISAIPAELSKMKRSWDLFNRFSPDESDYGSISSKWSSASAEIILAFRSRIEESKKLPIYDFINFETFLHEWGTCLHSHILAYSPTKVKATQLHRGGSVADKEELVRLCKWRIANVDEIQCQLNKLMKRSKMIVDNEEVFG
ncbi:hypothetical protein HDV01_004931, partial [Terramyces sp. JEL0728]